MTLQYGFNSHGWDKDTAKWSAKFEALDESVKDYYHNALPWALLVTAVGHVSKETIPVIEFRLRQISHGDEYVPSNGGVKFTDSEFKEFLGLFIGFEANVNTETDREWGKRFLPNEWQKKESLKSDERVRAERLRFEKEVFSADRKALYGSV